MKPQSYMNYQNTEVFILRDPPEKEEYLCIYTDHMIYVYTQII